MNLLLTVKPAQKTGSFKLSDKVELYYELRGTGKGTTTKAHVVIFSPMLATCKLVETLADGLGKHYEVLTYDYRGLGRSTSTEAPGCHTSEMYAEDALALLQHVWGPHSCVHLIGVSMGGYIAQMVALKLIPAQRLASLFLSRTNRGTPLRMKAIPYGVWHAMQPMMMGSDPHKQVLHLLEQCMNPETASMKVGANIGNAGQSLKDAYLEKLSAHWQDYFAFGPDSRDIGAAQIALCLRHWLTTKQLRALKASGVPMSCHVAGRDTVMTASYQKALAEKLACPTLTLHTGHICGPDDNRRVIRAMQDLIESAL